MLSSAALGTNALVYFVAKQHKIIPELGSACGIERKKERFASNRHELMADWLLWCQGQYLLKHLPIE